MADDTGRNVRSQVLQEANLVLKAYADSQEFKRDVEEGRFALFDKIKDKLHDDISRISQEHPVLNARIWGWKGDLSEAEEGLRAHNFISEAEVMVGLIRQMDTFEERANTAWATIQRFDKELPGLVGQVLGKGGLQSPEGKDHLLGAIKGVNLAFESWVITNQQVTIVIDKLHNRVNDTKDTLKDFSVKIGNYYKTGFDLDGLIKGTGQFAGTPHIADRYKILLRRIQSKPGEFRNNPATMKKLSMFFREYVQSQRYPNGQPWLLPEQVEPTKTDLQYYDEAVADLQRRNCIRHLYPWEMFTIIFDHLENPLSIYHDLGQDMLRGNGEWTALSFMKQGKTLHISENVTNLKWNPKSNDYELQGQQPNGRPLESQQEFPEKTQSWIRTNNLPTSFVQLMWGKTPEELKKYDAGSYLYTDNVWRPVALGDGGYYFILNAVSYQGASRGVRRK